MKTLPDKLISVLVVEDDLFMQGILHQCLCRQYNPLIVNDGMEAFNRLQQGKIPDIVISDLNTPHLNGLQLLERIKSSGFFNSVPLIILSGTEDTDTRIKCLEAGADDYILKPFNPRELIARINIILKRVGRFAMQ